MVRADWERALRLRSPLDTDRYSLKANATKTVSCSRPRFGH
ncbi:MAG: hypothetical protein GHCLOJNM_03572 [bacterium]|nr:hypothetical protein [bacterium]